VAGSFWEAVHLGVKVFDASVGEGGGTQGEAGRCGFSDRAWGLGACGRGGGEKRVSVSAERYVARSLLVSQLRLRGRKKAPRDPYLLLLEGRGGREAEGV